MNKISGKTEFDIFKNYYTTEKMESCRFKVNASRLQCKDNAKSERLRQLVARDFDEKNYNECLEKYTDSLRFASYNGREYAMALANRSAAYFELKNYKSCLIDIDLSLKADYPVNMKPKLLIRKAKCFIYMGNSKSMIETIDDCYNQIQNSSNLSKIDREKYMKEMKAAMNIRQVYIDQLSLEETALKPEVILVKNPLNPTVSASVKIKYNRNFGTDFVAARDIPCGEVLFVDEAYSIIGSLVETKKGSKIDTFVCDYCWNEAQNCIPCKTCINFLYCSEECRNNSWAEYHRWECDMFRSEIFKGSSCLPLRALIKAAFSGAIFKITSNTKACKFSNNDIDPYLCIYSMYLDLARFRSKCTSMLVECCEEAVLMVQFLKKTNFFTRLMSNSSCQKNFNALVNFVGALLIKLNIFLYQRSVNLSISAINKIESNFEITSRNVKCRALCPVVSGLNISCDSNTSMYFNGKTCIVKACKNIKAGNRISRCSLFNMTPIVSVFDRRNIYERFDINCECTFCEDVWNDSDTLNTYRCVSCRELTVIRLGISPILLCTNCKNATSIGPIIPIIARLCMIMNDYVDPVQGLKDITTGMDILKRMLNPNHDLLYKAYKKLLLMLSMQENMNDKFMKALIDFKTCAENRNGRFDKLEYVVDLIVICTAYLRYIQLNVSNLTIRETMEMLTHLSDTVGEAKEIAEFIFPPYLRILIVMESYILQLRVAHVTLQE